MKNLATRIFTTFYLYLDNLQIVRQLKKQVSEKLLVEDTRSYISARISATLDVGADSPESYARTLYHVHGVQVYYCRDKTGDIVGTRYQRHGTDTRYTGGDVGYTWATVAGRLAHNAGRICDHTLITASMWGSTPAGIFTVHQQKKEKASARTEAILSQRYAEKIV